MDKKVPEESGFKGTLPFESGEVVSQQDLGDIEKAASSKEDNVDTFKSIKRRFCARCGHDTAITNLPEISDSDRQDFIRAILGGRRYEKAYSLLGGKLNVVFRATTPQEVDLLLEQLRSDSNMERVKSDADYLCQHSRYRMALCISKLDIAGVGVQEYGIAVTRWENADRPQGYEQDPTRIRYIYDQLVNQWSEPLYNMILICSQQFHQEVDILTQRAWTSDFWPRTAGPTSQ